MRCFQKNAGDVRVLGEMIGESAKAYGSMGIKDIAVVSIYRTHRRRSRLVGNTDGLEFCLEINKLIAEYLQNTDKIARRADIHSIRKRRHGWPWAVIGRFH